GAHPAPVGGRPPTDCRPGPARRRSQGVGETGGTGMGDLKGKTALVTGASRGIGRGIARRLAADGALVAVHYATQEAAAEETAELIARDGGRAFLVRTPLGIPGDVPALYARLDTAL